MEAELLVALKNNIKVLQGRRVSNSSLYRGIQSKCIFVNTMSCSQIGETLL